MKTVVFQLLLLFWCGQAIKIPIENECSPPVVDIKAPKCELYVEAASENLNVSCPQTQVIRIVGDFKVLHINCSAVYPIDLEFDGIIPTEAIQVHSWRTINDSASGLEIELFHFDVKVLSISSLYEHFKASNSQVELRDEFKYSRTGEYKLKGFGENANHTTSFYIFLEEPLAKLDFIRNNRTVWKNDSSGIYLPCRPTHYLSNVTVNVNASPLEEVESYDATKGFLITTNASRSYTCEASLNEDAVHLTFDSTQQNPEVPFGFLKPLDHKGLTIIFQYDYEAQFHKKSSRTNVYSSCEASDQNQRPFQLNMMGARSYVELGLVSDFVLPAFTNRSFGLHVGEERPDLNQKLRTDGVPLRAGVTFCTNGVGYEAKLYGAGFTGNPYPFDFHHNMFNINRDSSNINLFMKIDQKDPTPIIYDGDQKDFTCQVLTHILVPPVVWFVRFINGSSKKVYVDYNLDDETSSFSLKAKENMSEVLCAVSMWHKEFWRNISHSITVLKTDQPSIVNGSNPVYIKVSKESPLALICHARGMPLPSITWELKEKDGTSTKLESSSSSTKNGKVISTLTVANPMEVTYICVARTGNYEDKKLFNVQFASSVEVWAIVLICLAVALAASLPVFIYFRFLRKHQPLGLTRYEIAEFVTGEVPESQRMKGNEYAHEFAQLCPYDKSYEIDATRFQIDKTSFLGKGAFGVVLKGLVDGIPVAVKMISKNAEKVHLKALLTELKIQIHLGDHSHVVRFIGANTKDLSKGTVYMFVELCSLGSLGSYLRANKDSFHCVHRKSSWTRHTIALQDLNNWTLQIASGMDYLSSKKVIHGDLAARNILLDDKRVAKITDFGLSRQFQAYADYVKKQVEPLPWRWMALESLQRLTFSSKSDVWAYGVTLWEIFTLGEVPYVGMSWNLNFVNELEEGLRLPKPRHAPEEFYKNIMLASWDNRPELRPSFLEIIQRIIQMFKIENESSVERPSFRSKTSELSVTVDLHDYQQGV